MAHTFFFSVYLPTFCRKLISLCFADDAKLQKLAFTTKTSILKGFIERIRQLFTEKNCTINT